MTSAHSVDKLRLHATVGQRADFQEAIETAAAFSSIPERIAFLSHRFLDTPYRDHPLGGGPGLPENPEIAFDELDCFTFLDLIEAMRRCHSWEDVAKTLKRIRYAAGRISYETRNHFFSGWQRNSTDWISDETATIGGPASVHVNKHMNRKPDGSAWVPGIPQQESSFDYIPSPAVDENILGQIQTGDYIGIYAVDEGLDVTHVGIFIRRYDATMLRHASSIHRKVVDEPFMDYVAGKPGILIYRPEGKKSRHD